VAVERAFVIESLTGFSSFVQIGVFGLDRTARELAAGVRGVTPAASGLHGEWVAALNGRPCSRGEGGRVGMECLGCCQSNKPGEKGSYDKRTPASRHGSSHTRFLASVNLLEHVRRLRTSNSTRERAWIERLPSFFIA
jgi:hypothetical protein